MWGSVDSEGDKGDSGRRVEGEGWMGASSQGRDSNHVMCDSIIIRHVEAFSCARHSSTFHWSSTTPVGSAGLSHFEGGDTEARAPDCSLLKDSGVLGALEGLQREFS